MKAWKKVAALVLALGLTAGFVACGSDNAGNGFVNNSSNNASGSVSDESSDVVVEDSSSDIVEDSSDVGGEVGGDVVGEEVSKEEFLAAREASYAATNLTVVYRTQNGEETRNYADGKMHSVGEVDGKEYECYQGEVDGVYYEWLLDYGEFIWEEMEWDNEYSISSGTYALDEVLYYCQVLTYWDFDEETGMFKIENFQSYTAYAMVSGGKIVKCRLEISDREWVEMDITYGNATVGELPSLE